MRDLLSRSAQGSGYRIHSVVSYKYRVDSLRGGDHRHLDARMTSRNTMGVLGPQSHQKVCSLVGPSF